MAELALREGYLTPADLPRGDCVMTRFYGDDGTIRLRIDRADPRILISAELLDDVAGHPDGSARLDIAVCHTYVGSVLKVHAVNRTVIYRITEYVPAIHGYIAEWPD